MKRYADQFTGWRPGHVTFVVENADLDTVKRTLAKSAAAIDMRAPMRLRAATIADHHIAASMQKST